jgi:hypothetical protein
MDLYEREPARHPGGRDLQRFMQCGLSRAEAKTVLRHLLTNCPQCLQVTRQLWRLGDEARLKIRKRRVPALELGIIPDEGETAASETPPRRRMEAME